MIRVRSTDAGGLTTEKQFTISVTDFNEAPAFTSSGTASVAEMALTSEVISTAAATDPDSTAPNNVVHYSIHPGVGASRRFTPASDRRMNSGRLHEASRSIRDFPYGISRGRSRRPLWSP